MNPSTALARVVVDELKRCGIEHVVLSPGSRSTPLALELAAAERAGTLDLHVRIDERSAGYLALGLARYPGNPVAIVCTSGTAVANLMPAVIEASYAGVPLLVLSADRPPELRNTGANQTIDQVGLFSTAVRWFGDLPAPTAEPGQVEFWRSLVRASWTAALGAGNSAGAGPAHLNVGFREPLIPDSDLAWVEDLNAGLGVPEVPPASPLREPLNYVFGDLGFPEVPARGLVMVGDIVNPIHAQQAADLAALAGWPLIAEPTGIARECGPLVAAGAEIVAAVTARADFRPDAVLTVGRVGLHRATIGLLRRAPVHVAVGFAGRDRPDPARTASALLAAIPLPPQSHQPVAWVGPDADWTMRWAEASTTAIHQIESILTHPPLSGLHVAAAVWEGAGPLDLVFAAASRSVRNLHTTMRPDANRPRVIGNRGASGIDGLVSSAWGAAIAHTRAQPAGRTIALLGDLAFLHDHNGMLVPAGESVPNLTIVVSDNNGGGIFSSLEQAAPDLAQDFERVFGTPHNLDLLQVARSTGVRAVRVATSDALVAELRGRHPGVLVIIAETADRQAEQLIQQRVQDAIAHSI